MRHRMSRHDSAAHIRAFNRGVPKHVLAKQYGISLASGL
jgi:hypothetical protein